MLGRVLLRAAVICSLLGGCGGGDRSGQTIEGTLLVDVPSSGQVDYVLALADAGARDVITKTIDDGPYFPCGEIPGGFEDLTEGAQVKVINGNGDTVGLGELGAGLVSWESDKNLGCQFTFEIDGVPTDEKFYEILIADRDPSETYSADDLEQADWHVDLTLG